MDICILELVVVVVVFRTITLSLVAVTGTTRTNRLLLLLLLLLLRKVLLRRLLLLLLLLLNLLLLFLLLPNSPFPTPLLLPIPTASYSICPPRVALSPFPILLSLASCPSLLLLWQKTLTPSTPSWGIPWFAA